MKDLSIIDNYVDDREFRNYVHSLLIKKGFIHVNIDDVRFTDNLDLNNNDILAEKDGILYTVQTFLNISVGKMEVDETVEDMESENASRGIIVTNSKVYDEIKEYAKEKLIDIWDREQL